MSENIWGMESPDVSTAYLIVRLANAHQRRLNQDLSPLGLTYSQFVLLAGVYWLEYRELEVTQVVISEFIKFDKSTVSLVLKTLIANKLVKRKEHPVDTRAKVINLTPEGQSMLERAIPIVKRADLEFYQDRGIDVNELNGMLAKLLE